jgi:hypothetical protein
MQIQVVTFNLNGLSDADYRRACDGWAPALAAVPGLISKVWLADEASNTYGGVYAWIDREAMEAFARSDFFIAFASNPSIANIAARAFGVLDGPSRVTGTPLAVAA